MINIQPALSDTVPHNDSLQLTPMALEHLGRRLKQTSGACGIVVGVNKAGCSGLKYVIETVSTQPTDAFKFNFNDRVTVFVPHESFPFLKGCTLDYVKQGLNAQLQIINPNAKGSCGCGESFSV